MAEDKHSAGESRQDQTFPVLSETDLERIRSFGSVRQYPRGSRLFTTGEPSPGMFALLEGVVCISQRDALGKVVPVERQGPGQFLGEVTDLSGRPRSSTALPKKTSRPSSSRPSSCAPCWLPRPTWASGSCAP